MLPGCTLNTGGGGEEGWTSKDQEHPKFSHYFQCELVQWTATQLWGVSHAPLQGMLSNVLQQAMASFFVWRNTPSKSWLNLPREVGGNISHCGRSAASLTWVAIRFLTFTQFHPCTGSSGGGTPSSVTGFNYEMTVAVAGFAWTSMCHQSWWEICKKETQFN